MPPSIHFVDYANSCSKFLEFFCYTSSDALRTTCYDDYFILEIHICISSINRNLSGNNNSEQHQILCPSIDYTVFRSFRANMQDDFSSLYIRTVISPVPPFIPGNASSSILLKSIIISSNKFRFICLSVYIQSWLPVFFSWHTYRIKFMPCHSSRSG